MIGLIIVATSFLFFFSFLHFLLTLTRGRIDCAYTYTCTFPEFEIHIGWIRWRRSSDLLIALARGEYQIRRCITHLRDTRACIYTPTFHSICVREVHLYNSVVHTKKGRKITRYITIRELFYILYFHNCSFSCCCCWLCWAIGLRVHLLWWSFVLRESSSSHKTKKRYKKNR